MTVKKDQNISELIKKTRKLAGLSQLELATRAGVGKTLVFNIEKGATNVSFENVLKILKVLNIKIDLKLPIQGEEQ